MTKRVKVFEMGKYPQGNFTADKVNEIFGNVKEVVKGIFIHSTKWQAEGKEPIECGEFSNFSVENGKAYADLKLNEKGEGYYNDGIFKGISAEISKGLDRIALLPIGIKPAIAGAEFEAMEFEEVTTTNIEGGKQPMTIDEIVSTMAILTEEQIKELAMKVDKKVGGELAEYIVENGDIKVKMDMLKCVKNNITNEEKSAARALAYEFAKSTDEPAPAKTELQIREEITKEFEAKAELERLATTAESELKEFEALVKTKVFPAHIEAYIEAFKASQGKSDTLEFEEGKVTMTEHLKAKVAKMTEADNLRIEFAKDKGENREVDKVAEAKKRVKNYFPKEEA